jgi:hypothetical protein
MSMGQFQAARAALEDPGSKPDEIWRAMSDLRTRLKVELGVRNPVELR